MLLKRRICFALLALIFVACSQDNENTKGHAAQSGAGAASASSSGEGGGSGDTGGHAGHGGSSDTGGHAGHGGSGDTGGFGGAIATGGNGGMGGAASGNGGGSSTGSGGAGGSGGGGPGSVCTWAIKDPCGPGLYCKAPGCGMGTCEPIGVIEEPAQTPVCGCDKITYWNESIAASHGMAVQGNGECAAGVGCGGIGGSLCPPGLWCNMRDYPCMTSDPYGRCWAAPAICDSGAGVSKKARRCGEVQCTTECEAVKVDWPWFIDATCP